MTDLRPPPRPVPRRAVLAGGLAAVGALVTGCGSGPGGRTAPTTTPSAAPTSAPTATTPPPETPHPVTASPALQADLPAYAVLDGEVEPACKQTAVDYVTAVLTAGTVASTDPLDTRLAALRQQTGPAGELRQLLPAEGASGLEVVYPQYGGLSRRRDLASVMVVADQLLTPAGPPGTPPDERRSLTVDVRLQRAGDGWTVTDAILAAPAPEASMSPAVRELLENDRVMLPAAARADLLSGEIHEAVVAAVSRLARTWVVDVHVLVSGHPEHVFGTDRVSSHIHGRAVDIWALDGIPVIDHARSPWREALLEAAATGATEVGGPEVVRARGAFTDHVHQDHLHLGFRRV